jgi:hypothetical protein
MVERGEIGGHRPPLQKNKLKSHLDMSRNILGTILQKRRYSEELQRLFADLSGDYNPLHVDPVPLPAGDALEVMLPLVRLMESFTREAT